MKGDFHSVFDADWYLAKYPDVEKTEMQPLQHYLCYGERLGRKPGPAFDPLFYAESYPDVVESGTNLLTHFVTIGQREGRRGHAETIQDYMKQLWRREHTVDCLKALREFTKGQQIEQVRVAAWTLARWHSWEGDWQSCLQWLQCYYSQTSPENFWPVIHLLYCEALARNNQVDKAYHQAQALERKFPDYLDVYLIYSNILLSQREKFSSCNFSVSQHTTVKQHHATILNTIFSRYELATIAFKAPSSEISLDSIRPINDKYNYLSSSVVINNSPLVSVIVPVFNAGNFLKTSLQSLAQQTLPNFEVLVVDDASTDTSFDIAQRFAQKDSRFKVFQLTNNQGAYAARNQAIKLAEGAFITVHDADDWAHPDKLACQVKAFKSNPHWVANTSDMVRCTTAMHFMCWRVPDIPEGGWIYRNTSSLMFKRNVFEKIGYWDRVRCSADTEYLHRILAVYGDDAYGEVLKGVPLAFCRHLEGSLSQVGPLHLITLEKGVRRDYMEAAKAWHASAINPESLYLPDSPAERPFDAPSLNLPI